MTEGVYWVSLLLDGSECWTMSNDMMMKLEVLEIGFLKRRLRGLKKARLQVLSCRFAWTYVGKYKESCSHTGCKEVKKKKLVVKSMVELHGVVSG